MMIPAIILAAGRSTRMGSAKALLTLPPDGSTFLDRLTRSLTSGGAAGVSVVGRPDDRALALEVDRLGAAGCGVRLVENADADRGQLSSVVAGMNAADRPGVHGIIVTPVDAPLLRPETIRCMLAVFDARR